MGEGERGKGKEEKPLTRIKGGQLRSISTGELNHAVHTGHGGSSDGQLYAARQMVVGHDERL